jgi:hypothetical protein
MITRTHYINPNVADHGFRSTFRDWCGDETKHERETAEPPHHRRTAMPVLPNEPGEIGHDL